MCGIAGFLTPAGFHPSDGLAVVKQMADAVTSRGPDDSGYWVDEVGIALGHRRLSIIDLSAAGHQPMTSESGDLVLIFNGEIYNHLELRERLGHSNWRGHSDTETLLAGFQVWGFEDTLKQATGMFALALWDRATRTLSLARDRMGEKPLYYGWQGGSLLFASELKALSPHPMFRATIDRCALGMYVRRGYVPAPQSIFTGILKLPGGAIVQIKRETVIGELPSPRQYWSLSSVVNDAANNRFDGSADEAANELESLLTAAIKGQQISDVPLGAFLSGGIDSSTVVALMQASSSKPVKTYTIGFQEQGYDEAKYAAAVAGHLKTDHTELYVSPLAAMDVIPELPAIYDEPFADISQIPMVLVSRLARQNVTVALSGDGGDELFCGYGRYWHYVNTWKKLSRVPVAVRSTIAHVLPHGPLREGIASQNLDSFYHFKNSQWKGCPRLVIGANANGASEPAPKLLNNSQERLMYDDAVNYLPDDILVKVDRAAMSTSLETRVPLLDHHVVAFAWRLPIEIKYRDGFGKWPLRQVLNKYVPTRLIDRPKMGFGVPMEVWLRGPLRDWAEALLSEARLSRDAFFDPVAVRKHWHQHLAGTHNRHYGLWTILMFQAWYEASTRRASAAQLT